MAFKVEDIKTTKVKKVATRRPRKAQKTKMRKVAGVAGGTAIASVTGAVISYNRRKGNTTRAGWLTAIPVLIGGAFEIFGNPDATTTRVASTVGTSAAAAGIGDYFAKKIVDAQERQEDIEEDFDQEELEEEMDRELLEEEQVQHPAFQRRAVGSFTEDD
jgi:hypothetical protein